MPQRLIGFTLLVLMGVLEPFSLKGQDLQPPPPAGLQTALFAGGCFWCMVHPFEVIDGVISTISGYTGGSVANPTYEQVSAGGTGHRESVEVLFDPKKVSYETLLDVYWRNIDPFDDKGQFCDKGNQYRSAIFVANDEQKLTAEASKRKFEERFDRPIATDIRYAGTFYRAEEYHQDYYKKNPRRYRFYRFSCGRDARLKQVWGDEAGGSEK
ncbi:MAG: peptide-methionine (S)-S-oxide reductase MsrA [Rhodospirillales bacterium]